MCGVESYVVVILSRYLVDQNIKKVWLLCLTFGADLFLVICGNNYISCNILPFLARCGVNGKAFWHISEKNKSLGSKIYHFLESWYGYTMVQNLKKKCNFWYCIIPQPQSLKHTFHFYFFIDEWAGRMGGNKMKKNL